MPDQPPASSPEDAIISDAYHEDSRVMSKSQSLLYSNGNGKHRISVGSPEFEALPASKQAQILLDDLKDALVETRDGFKELQARSPHSPSQQNGNHSD